MASKSPLAQLVRRLRRAKAWTQEELARYANCSLRTIQRVEHVGIAGPENLNGIAAALEVEPSRLTLLLPGASGPPATAETVASYSQQFMDVRATQSEPLVPLPVIDGGFLLSCIVESLAAKKHVAVIGAAGTGKSHTSCHAALHIARTGGLPIWARARNFEGSLQAWLDHEVAPFTRHLFPEIFAQACVQSCTRVLFVDGYDECRPDLRESLIEEIHGLLLRDPELRLVVTSQQRPPLSATLSLECVRLAPCDAATKTAILTAYDPSAANRHLEEIEALTTPFDLSLAGRAWMDLDGVHTSYDLRRAYASRLAEQIGSPDLVFLVLRKLAAAMNESLRLSMPFHQFQRLCEREARTASDRRAIPKIRTCSLLEVDGTKVAFSHEHFYALFLAEEILVTARDLPQLVHQIDRPRYSLAVPLLLQAQTDADAVAELLRRSTEAQRLMKSMAAGSHGPVARLAVEHEVARLIRSCEDLLVSSQVVVTMETVPFFPIRLSLPRDLTPYEQEVLRCLGNLSEREEWFGIAARFLGSVDHFVECQLARIEQQEPATCKALAPYGLRALLYHATYSCASLHGESYPPAALVVSGAGYAWANTTLSASVLSQLAQPEELSPGVFLLLCRLAGRRLFEETPSWITYLPTMLRVALRSRFGLLQFEVLELTASHAQGLTIDLRADIKLTLESSRVGRNPMFSGVYLRALEAAGAELQLDESVETTLTRVTSLLDHPDDPETQQEAYRLVTLRFEDVQAIYESVEAAIAQLAPLQECRLLAMAVLGAPDWGFLNEYCVESLAGHQEVRHEPLAAKAFYRWAAPPEEEGSFPQQRVNCFVKAHLALGQLCAPPYAVSSPISLRERVWTMFGRIFHAAALDTVDSGHEDIDAIWDELEQSLFCETIDVLHQILSCGAEPVPHLHVWRDRLQSVLSRILALDPATLPVNKSGGNPRRSFVSALGEVGDLQVRGLLVRLSDDLEVGAQAVLAIARIDARSEPASGALGRPS